VFAKIPADLQTILPSVVKAGPSMLLIEGANPRHEHEWEIWTSRELPDDKVLVPGVIDTSTTTQNIPSSSPSASLPLPTSLDAIG
jgi:hypothetical protein